MSKYATGKHSKAISDRSGLEFPYREMVREWNGSFVHYTEFEPKQPQLEPKPMGGDGVALLNVRPDRIEPITTVMITQNCFETYAAGSGIINGLSPGTGTTTNPVFAYASIPNFDGITGAQIGQGSGYAITTGLYDNGARVTTDYALSNFFFFTVNADTATTGNINGGGYGCSIGPITIQA